MIVFKSRNCGAKASHRSASENRKKRRRTPGWYNAPWRRPLWRPFSHSLFLTERNVVQQRVEARRIPADSEREESWKELASNYPAGPYSSRASVRVRRAAYMRACVRACIACVSACVRACNAGARPRGRPDLKEKSGSDATEYIIDSFLSTYARLKSRSGLRVNLSVPETDYVREECGMRSPR